MAFFCTHTLRSRRHWIGPQTGGIAGILMLRLAAIRLAGGQALLTGLVAVIATWLGGADAGWSAVGGGGIGIVAGLCQAWMMFRRDASEDPRGFMRSVYSSEAVKMVLTIVLIIVAIQVPGIELLPFLIGYIAIYSIYWIALGTGYPWIK